MLCSDTSVFSTEIAAGAGTAAAAMAATRAAGHSSNRDSSSSEGSRNGSRATAGQQQSNSRGRGSSRISDRGKKQWQNYYNGSIIAACIIEPPLSNHTVT